MSKLVMASVCFEAKKYRVFFSILVTVVHTPLTQRESPYFIDPALVKLMQKVFPSFFLIEVT